ncbi:MAG: lysylphosphatidylglycerol synthase transmembrane domain-containing protein [Burkholderiales bacterium]|nr:lysylphosphatidylglycerol synthase transmembrane domain-containing protein [Burkholderiales bacterium]MDP2399334.1 lysylphosphatidylglycerol synthase transmembrane domain-containing protein [Burkholderiales bacterium]
MTARKWLLAAGFLLSATFLAAILWRMDWPVFVAEFRNLQYVWLGAALIFIVFGMALRALRWGLAAGMPMIAFPAFWNSAVIGIALNQIYPLRAGEVIRIFALRKMASVPLGQAATSALIDRLADALLLGVCAVAVVATHTGLPYAENLAVVTLIVAVAALMTIILFGKGDHIWRRWSTRWGGRVPAKFAERIQRFYAGAVQTADQIASPIRLGKILVLTAIVFVCDIAVFFTVIQSFGWTLPTIAPVTVLVFLAIGTSLPAAPGYAGVYQLACVLALALFGVAESSAVAYSIVLQICVLVTIVPLAALAAAAHREELNAVRSELAKAG